MARPFELRERVDLKDYMPDEMIITEATIKVTETLYAQLVDQVRQEMMHEAMASIEWELGDPAPVIDISFQHLESLRFKLEPELRALADHVSSIHARDGLIAMFQRVIAGLRELDDEYFEQFYDQETGRSGTDPPPEEAVE